MKPSHPFNPVNEIDQLDLKSRKCFCCENPLNINDYHDSNEKNKPPNLMLLWQNPNIELLCCRCYMRLKRIQMLINADPSLKEGDYISKRMLQISNEKTRSLFKTIAKHSDGRLKKIMNMVETLDL